jgi:hemerythrin-like metal-binding protein/PAS domain S-box-containing protein
MSILTWNDQLLVGIESVDNQHRHLVVLINRLDELNALGADLQTVLETVKQLVDYTVDHFQHEEQLMMEAGFNPRMQAQHCQQHQEFIDKMQQVHVEAQSDVSVISKDLLDFLVDWLCHHILKTDKLMAISLNQGIDAEQVSIDKDEHVDILHSNLYSALRESEERFKELADHLPALIWITNAKNLPIFCNRFWFKTFNIQRGFVDRRQWLNTIHAEDRDKVVQAYQQAAAELTKFKIQYRLCAPDGAVVWILETAVPRVRKSGEFAGLMGCGMDISTQKQAESALLKINQQLEERVRERTQALTEANQTLELEKTSKPC